MNFKPIFILAFMALTYVAHAQDPAAIIKGQVSFVTSQNIYVQFQDTKVIEIGDSLRLAGADTSCLVVKSKSTTSCVCTLLESCSIEKGDKVEYLVVVRSTEHIVEKPMIEIEPPLVAEEEEESLYKESIRGRVSASSYSTLASERDDRHRIMGRLSMYANHIKDSKFSFNTYLNYREILDQKDSSSLQQTSFFRVYNLGVRYDATPIIIPNIGEEH